MRSKKLAIVAVAVLAALAFGGSYALSRWFGKGPAQAAGQTEVPPPGAAPIEGTDPEAFDHATRLDERHLRDLVKSVRQKLRDCEQREQRLLEEESRIRIARQDLQKEAQALETVRVQLATAVAGFKEAKADLERTRVAIRRDEQANLKRAAGIYDKMDATNAAAIFETMCNNNQETDAAKILHYMQERAVAKILGEMADKQLAARLSERMKHTTEGEPAPGS